MATPGGRSQEQGLGFVNPYNFVPLRPCRRQALPEEAHLLVGGRTGRFTVEMELLTPASVSPALSHDPDDLDERDRELGDLECRRPRRDEDGHVWFPGSSLKGAFRTVLEPLSESCMPVLDEKRRPSWRPVRPSRPGLLFRRSEEEFFVEPATDVRIEDHPGWRTGERRSVPALSRGRGMLYESSSGRGYDGTVVIADVPKDSNKRWQRLFVPSGGTPLPVARKLIDESDLAHQQQISDDGEAELIPVGRGYRRRREALARLSVGERRPVWYRVDDRGRVASLGPVALFREMWALSAGALLDREPGSSLRPCDGGETACAACRLFGLTWGDGAGRRASSGWRALVGFGPARSDAPVPRRRPVVLPPAGAPKPSAQTFYLWDPARPGAPDGSWYGSPSARLRGRKLYWHQPGVTERLVVLGDAHRRDISESGDPVNQLRAIELVPAGTRFRFEVRFEGLSDADLGLLVLTLEPGRLAELWGRPGGHLAHKIGGGKPLGLGSARARIVESAALAPDRYRSLAAPGESPLDLEAGVAAAVREYGLTAGRDDLEALVTLLDLRGVPASTPVRYPPGGDGRPHRSYEWFAEFARRDRDGRPRDADPLRTVREVRAGGRQRGWDRGRGRGPR